MKGSKEKYVFSHQYFKYDPWVNIYKKKTNMAAHGYI